MITNTSPGAEESKLCGVIVRLDILGESFPLAVGVDLSLLIREAEHVADALSCPSYIQTDPRKIRVSKV